RIADHHRNDPWRPKQPWPDDCLVQWGGSGIVVAPNRTYRTAFFEAFPKDGAGRFIRGEGATIEDAEIAAFGKWKRQHDCFLSGGHRWGRALRIPPRGDKTDVETRDGKSFGVLVYTNGGCHCLEC